MGSNLKTNVICVIWKEFCSFMRQIDIFTVDFLLADDEQWRARKNRALYCCKFWLGSNPNRYYILDFIMYGIVYVYACVCVYNNGTDLNFVALVVAQLWKSGLSSDVSNYHNYLLQPTRSSEFQSVGRKRYL